MDTYDPFAAGRFPVGTSDATAHDPARQRDFPYRVWHPAGPGPYPVVVFSHHSGGNRGSASFLCTHLASHGYAVAAMDHFEVVAADLAARARQDAQRDPSARQAWIETVLINRVADLRFLLDHLLDPGGAGDLPLDPDRVGLAGHSMGGWSVLATVDSEPRVGAVAALAPGGAATPRPGVVSAPLALAWDRDVPALYLAAEHDVPIPPAAVREVYQRTPASKRMYVLRDADHQHFMDDVAEQHEALRAMSLPGEAAWMPGAMKPIEQLCSQQQAHTFVRGLVLAHFDATLRGDDRAAGFLAGDVVAELAARGVPALAQT
ncbi:MAG: dienelactone hydrolase family protein [Micromonosporaceae bacterium]|nr:dienelactone hydrolase family protein [Micromonosporaceae bacterium]